MNRTRTWDSLLTFSLTNFFWQTISKFRKSWLDTQSAVLHPSISFAQQGLDVSLLQDRIPCIHLALSGACHKTKAGRELRGEWHGEDAKYPQSTCHHFILRGDGLFALMGPDKIRSLTLN